MKQEVGLIVLLLFLGFVLTGCNSTKGPEFDPRGAATGVAIEEGDLRTVGTTGTLNGGWLQTSTNLFRLGPGDVLEIEILGDPDTRTETLVGPDGKIYYHLLSGIDVWGLTLAETKQRLEDELQQFYRDNPRVAVILREVHSKRVWLLGRFNTPGVYNITNHVSLLEAVSMAGGPSVSTDFSALQGSPAETGKVGATEEVADLRRAFLIRDGERLPIDFKRLLEEGDMSQNIYLRHGDFVYLPSMAARDLYVMGAVRLPNAVEYREDMTLSAAIAEAGGTVEYAYLSHVAIVRGSLNEPKIAIVDFGEIIDGDRPDVLLHPRDIVYIPYSPYETLYRYANLIVHTFVRTVGVNEGARAVTDEETAPVGVNVPVSP